MIKFLLPFPSLPFPSLPFPSLPFPSLPINLPFVRDGSIKIINRYGSNSGLIIIFDSNQIFYQLNDFYQKKGLENIVELNKRKDPYPFYKTLLEIGNCNLFFIRDNYYSWYQINFEKYLSALTEEIKKINPKKIACIGISAGGFAAIQFGSLLSVNAVYAFCPQTFSFPSKYMGIYHHALNEKYLLSIRKFSDTKDFLNKKTDYNIFYCKNNSVDARMVNRLTGNNIYKFPIDCNVHDVYDHLNMKDILKEIVDYVVS